MNKVTHFEIPADDTTRAVSFYKKVFDWEINKMPSSDFEYNMVYTDEVDEEYMPKSYRVINGAIAPKDEFLKSPTIVATVESIDVTIDKVKNNGGTLQAEKVEIPNMGFYARIIDTEGNSIGIWEDKK